MFSLADFVNLVQIKNYHEVLNDTSVNAITCAIIGDLEDAFLVKN